MAGRLVAVALTLMVLVFPGCTSAPSWTPVALPGGATPVVIAASPDGLLVGTRLGTGAPGLVTVQGSAATQGSVQGQSSYATEAQWTSLATAAGNVVAVAGVRGGAHGNVRWTIWRGSASALTEEPQTFETFGGWGMGTLTGATFTGSAPLLVGSWSSETAGLEPAVWRASGTTWTRVPSQGTALANTATFQHQVQGVAALGGRAVLVGRTLHLGPTLTSVASVWFVGSTVEARQTLPAPTGLVAGQAVSCDAGHCLVVGHADGRLVAWLVDGVTATALSVPAENVADTEILPTPVIADQDLVILAPDHDGTLLLRSRDGGAAWSTSEGPQGNPVAVARAGSSLYVLTEAAGQATLWLAPW